MGRGLGCPAEEIADLARAWVYATEDPIVGIDQTAGRFSSTMFEKFKSLSPTSETDKAYGGGSAKSSRSKVDHVCGDSQKFGKSLKFIEAFDPTGVTEDQVFPMAVARHLGKRETMSYEA